MTVRILTGDCRSVLGTLPDCSVQTCVTSPPYYRLRDNQHPDQIGLEACPDDYIAAVVNVFKEVRRVLKENGTLFINWGDTYLDKQRLLIPARVALALQSDGWWLRDEIVWHKPRLTPAPVKDRTVAAHEMIYLLAKSPKYHFDYLAIEEASLYPGLRRKAGKAFRDLAAADPNAARKRPGADREIVVRDTKRKRSVWSVSTSPYVDGHFSTMPPEIAETCILAGARAGDTVLDPFSGAGTTALVADRLRRNAIGIEVNPSNVTLSEQRLSGDAGMFAWVAAE